MADTGYISPGTMADDSTVGTISWSNPNNAKASDGSYATAEKDGTYLDSPVDGYAKIVKADGSIGTTDKAGEDALDSSDTYRIYGGSTEKWGETWSYTDINDSDFGFVFAAGFFHAIELDYEYSEYLKATNFGFSIPSGATIDGIEIGVEQQGERWNAGGGGGFPPEPDDWQTKAWVDHIRIKVYYTETSGTNMQINISDTFKEVPAMKINIGDTWKDVTAVKQNIGDTWKTVF